MKKTWYEIRDAGDSVVEVLLYGEIGSWGISAKDFVNELGALKASTINVRINSDGGVANEGITIYNALRDHGATVHTIVDGAAYSIASVIAQAGETRVMNRGSTMMIHEPYALAIGDEATMLKEAEVLRLMANNIAGLFAGRAGGAETEWRERMRAESWYRGQDAVDIGLADGIVEGPKAQVPVGIFNLSRFKNVPDWVPQDEGAAISIENPYPNEHACRLRDPGDFKEGSFRRTSREHEGKSYDVILGRLEGETTMTEQAYRYPKGTWDADEARSHCQDHDGTFEAASSDKTEDDLPEINPAEALESSVSRIINKEIVIPDCDFLGALDTAIAKGGY